MLGLGEATFFPLTTVKTHSYGRIELVEAENLINEARALRAPASY